MNYLRLNQNEVDIKELLLVYRFYTICQASCYLVKMLLISVIIQILIHKILASYVEALFGAVYLDGGWMLLIKLLKN